MRRKKRGHSNQKDIMKIIYLAFCKSQREVYGANVICPTFQMENVEIIKYTESPIFKLWTFTLRVILCPVVLKIIRKRALAKRAQKTLMIGTLQWAS